MDETSKVKQAALRYLARRDHSVAELQRKLLARGFSHLCVTAVMEHFITAGYLDDERFARNWAESSLRNGKGCGARLRDDLRRRGITVAIIENTLRDVAADYDELTFAKAILTKKFSHRRSDVPDDREKRRMAAYLQRRGVSGGVIWQLIHCCPVGEE